MKSFLFLLSFLALAVRRSTYAFAPKAPASTASKQLVQQESTTALEAYALGGYGYANGNNGLMYRSGGYGRYNDNYSPSRYYGGYGGGYGGYGGYGGGYSLMPDSAVRGYGGMYDRNYYNSPYTRYGSGYNGYYNGYYNSNRFDNNRRYFNSWSDYRYDSPYRYNRLEP